MAVPQRFMGDIYEIRKMFNSAISDISCDETKNRTTPYVLVTMQGYSNLFKASWEQPLWSLKVWYGWGNRMKSESSQCKGHSLIKIIHF